MRNILLAHRGSGLFGSAYLERGDGAVGDGGLEGMQLNLVALKGVSLRASWVASYL